MTYVLKNSELTVEISSRGGEPVSAKRGACEYIWQGDPASWKGQAPLLFPTCGRLLNGKYSLGGKEYELGNHGFLRTSELSCVRSCDSELVLCLQSSPETLACYPFDFSLELTYRLQGACLSISAQVENRSADTMPFTFGGHPGFNVPLDGNGGFEDWYLEFAAECDPDRIEIAPNGLQTGIRTAYPLAERRLIPLCREDYAVDGIFLADMARRITLKSATSCRSVTLNYPQMPYLGIWQPGGCDAPFICIEPWCGLPDYHNRALDFSQKAQMFHLPSGCSANTGFEIIFE